MNSEDHSPAAWDREADEEERVKVKRALVSVSDKRDLEPFVRGLVELGVEVISTGGTARHLREAGLPIIGISEVTGFPEIMDGRVKTLHPAIHGGILADRDRPSHMKAIAELGIKPIDLVVVNLYPFEATVAQRGVSEIDAVENIDIGGPCMVRAAAKNFAGVGIVTDPADYDSVLAELKDNQGELSRGTRRRLATKAFHHTAHYDSAIAAWFGEQEEDFPSNLMLDLTKIQDLRYGENPHQRAAWYSEVRLGGELAAALEQHHGQQLSFNNLLDLDSCRRVLDEFTLPCCVIVKHNNPCGAAVAETVAAAYDKAVSCDPVSAFGGVIAVNRMVDEATARSLSTNFVEVLWAPGYADEAMEILTQKKDIRILTGQHNRDTCGGFDMKRIIGGMLVQDWDCEVDQRENMEVISTRHPTESGVGRPALRLAGGEEHQVERHHPGQGPHDRGCGRGADEPGGLGQPGGIAGPVPAGRLRGGLRRLLPLPGRPPGDGRCRSDLRDPSRRLEAGRRVPGSGRGPGHGHGGDGATALQTLGCTRLPPAALVRFFPEPPRPSHRERRRPKRRPPRLEQVGPRPAAPVRLPQ